MDLTFSQAGSYTMLPGRIAGKFDIDISVERAIGDEQFIMQQQCRLLHLSRRQTDCFNPSDRQPSSPNSMNAKRCIGILATSG